VWDIATSVPITQLIAHDREVYDVAWSPATRDVFASVGADGSVRMFDLRALEHSTILYEASPPSPSSTASSASSSSPVIPTPLLRLAFSPTAPTYLSVCHADSKEVQILDTRSPGTPAMEVRGHKASVNGMAWGGATMSSRNNHGSSSSGPGCLATVGTFFPFFLSYFSASEGWDD
jgi:WD repeat-containing protein 68